MGKSPQKSETKWHNVCKPRGRSMC